MSIDNILKETHVTKVIRQVMKFHTSENIFSKQNKARKKLFKIYLLNIGRINYKVLLQILCITGNLYFVKDQIGAEQNTFAFKRLFQHFGRKNSD